MTLLIRVHWETVVRVLTDSVVPLLLSGGIDVNHNAAEMRQVMKKLVPDLLRDLTAVPHRQAARHRDADVGMQPMADPTRPHVTDVWTYRAWPSMCSRWNRIR